MGGALRRRCLRSGTGPPNSFDGGIINAEILAPSPYFLDVIGSPRPYVGTDIAISDNPINTVYTGLNWQVHVMPWLYVGFSGGGAWADSRVTTDTATNTTKDLGSNWLFHLQASVGIDITPALMIEVFYNHFSNASISNFNVGLESIGGRAGYRF